MQEKGGQALTCSCGGKEEGGFAFTGVVLFTMASTLSQQTGSSFARLASCVSLVGGRGWHEEKLMVM